MSRSIRKHSASTLPVQAPEPAWLTVRRARHNNLKSLDVGIPLGRFVCVTGVSGSGKSSLVIDILMPALAAKLNGVDGATAGAHDGIDGLEHLDKVIDVDQSPIGRTPRSNPATYTKVFDEIRDLFAKLPDAKVRGYSPGRFSFNVACGEAGGGRCEACEGNGANRVEMDFLADVWVTCPVCDGRRFNHESLQVHFKGKSIADVLDMDVQQAMEHFAAIPKIHEMLKTLHDVGLDYLKLGQSSTTLSGGEAQRIKLARELVRRSTGRTLYILDEPTTGLHFEDIRRLLAVLHGFVDAGNSVVVIEHNLDVIKTADWVIDLGPEGGEAGGRIVAEGTPEEVARCTKSHTGWALRAVLNETPRRQKVAKSKLQTAGRPRAGRPRASSPRPRASSIRVLGAREHNLKDVSVSIPRGAMTVCSGVSGSGKSSFAIDTVYAEGHRRYVESLSAYARQFLGQLQKPKVDHVEGLSPAIAIEQKAASKSPRSTVGTITEIYDYMRVLWARVGEPHCPKCGIRIGTQTSDEILDRLLALEKGTRLHLCASIECRPGETWAALLERCKAQGYVRARVDGRILELTDVTSMDEGRRHTVELVVDRLVIGSVSRARLADSVEHCLALGRGILMAVVREAPLDGTTSGEASTSGDRSAEGNPLRFSQHLSCTQCGVGYDELTPHHFSFNSRLGWCERCEGLGVQRGTSADTVIVRPDRSLLDGAIAGWEDAADRPLLAAMIVALGKAMGCDPWRPVSEMTAEQRHALLFGLGERWIEVRVGKEDLCPTEGLRFQWKGFFPTIDEATRISWKYRMKLQDLVSDVDCQSCGGGRVAPFPAAARLGGRTIGEVCATPLTEAGRFLAELGLDRRRAKIAGELLHEIKSRLAFLLDVGLGYLSLGRAAPTLSGGEAQRIRLASQIGSGLTGVLYVLDEPTIGLHPRDNERLIAALHKLRNLGNTLLMVEHDREVIAASDHVLDFGPGAGQFGGRVVAEGSPKQLREKQESLTGQYLGGNAAIAVPTNRRVVSDQPSAVSYQPEEGPAPRRKGRAARAPIAVSQATQSSSPKPQAFLTIVGARQNNLKSIDVSIPLGRFVCITGVSGSGKSSLVTDILYPALAARIHRARLKAGAHDEIRGLDFIDKVINVDQQPIGDSPLSSAITYTGIFDLVRELFARLSESKVRGFTANRFSFNRPGGRCEDCEGLGQVRHEMHFLPDVWVPCEACGGARYQRETLEVRYKGKSIADILEMSVSAALEHFANVPKVRRLLQTLEDVGLGYLPLGQSAVTLSGGEAQRVKLAAELGRPQTGKTVYILDEPTTGLHFDDLRKLLDVLHRLVDLGNSVICIEHNLDVIKTADWIVDLGPEAGDAGGRVVASGTPEEVSLVEASYTGRLLRKPLSDGPRVMRSAYNPAAAAAAELVKAAPADEPAVKMPWERDGRKWHTQDRLSRDGKPVEWEGGALEFVIQRMEKSGKSRLLPVDWSDRARVEVAAMAPEGLAQSAVPWFFHALTGGRWLLDLLFRVPTGTFDERRLSRELALKTLDDREDIQAYGQTARVQLRAVSREMDQVRVLVHDRREIDTSAFRAFLDAALQAYLEHVAALAKDEARAEPWKTDGRAWHLSQKQIPTTQPIRWKPMDLIAFMGRVRKALPDVIVDWNRQVFVELAGADGRRVAKVVTHQGDALRVDIQIPIGRFTPTQVEGLGHAQELGRPGSSGAGLSFWFRTLSDVDIRKLDEVLHAAAAPEEQPA